MKILHVLNHSVPHVDGYCIRSSDIVHVQKETGLEPVVVTSPHQEPEPTVPVETIEGIRYYRILPHRAKRFPFLHELHAMRRLRVRIEEVIRLERPDVLHAHSPPLWGAATSAASRRYGVPFVYEIRAFWEGPAACKQGDPRLPLKYRLGRYLETKVARQADAVTVISSALCEQMVRRGIDPAKVFLTPNGVIAHQFSPRERDTELAASLQLNGDVILGYLGSLYAWEGVDDLIRAMPLVVCDAPKVNLLIVGGGPREAEIRRLIDELGLQKHVVLVGRVPHTDVTRYYSIMDIMVYPRKRNRTTETVTPLKPLEAMLMEKPVIASDVGGLRELCGPQTAVYFRAHNVSDLAAQCVRLVRSPELRRVLGSKAREHVAQTRDWSVLGAKYPEIYTRVTKRSVAT